MKEKLLLTRWLKTPLGPLEIGVNVSQSTKPTYQYFEFKQMSALIDVTNSQQHELLDLAEVQFEQYFAGNRRCFTELEPFFHKRGTEFQQQVWQALLKIEYGTTCTYSDIAHAIGKPKAVRAVGAANGKNSLAIVVPCHRVIGANGTLTGYAGGLDKKQWLLSFEVSCL